MVSAAKYTEQIEKVLSMCSDNNWRLWLLIKSTHTLIVASRLLFRSEVMSVNQSQTALQTIVVLYIELVLVPTSTWCIAQTIPIR